MKAQAVVCSALLALPALAEPAASVPWSFTALRRPAVPAVADAGWAKDDIDRYALSYQAAAGLKANADASRAELIRRATLDLHGLLPTVEEVSSFVRDPGNDDAAMAALVDRLLKSPRFGEKWARHWLDVVRYADSTGRAWNAPLIYAFRYRDWVIDSLNEDKPYTRFLSEQIAGDLLPAKTPEDQQQAVIATGMLTLGSLDLQALQYQQFLLDRVDDQIDVTTRAFMGMTVACARCHDHKTDPVSQKDYYALAGLFTSSESFTGTAHKTELGPSLYVDVERLIYQPLKPKTASVAATAPAATTLKPGEVNPFDDDDSAMSGMSSMASMEKGRVTSYDYDPALLMGVKEGEIADCPVRKAGDPYDAGVTPHRGDMQIPGLPPLPRVAAGKSGRLELAQWLCQPTHPLTSRVMVNRLWAQLFGKGLVTTVDNFGISGERPLHPELLDHLAVRFVTNGWSVKQLLRSIMLSRVYRQSSAGSAASHGVDPDNTSLWRVPPRRMTFETLRDCVLQVSGELSHERPSGIPIAGNGGKGNTARTRSLLGIEAPYRTIFLPVLRDLLPESYSTWDFPNPSQIQGVRSVTTVAPQALFMLNDRFMLRSAEALAGRVLDHSKQDAESLRYLYLTLFAREPNAAEADDAESFLHELEADSEEARWSALAQALLGSAEFRYNL
jgi:hypothetical protein